jgi:peptidoglycan hydrolase CwlO-like protein
MKKEREIPKINSANINSIILAIFLIFIIFLGVIGYYDLNQKQKGAKQDIFGLTNEFTANLVLLNNTLELTANMVLLNNTLKEYKQELNSTQELRAQSKTEAENLKQELNSMQKELDDTKEELENTKKDLDETNQELSYALIEIAEIFKDLESERELKAGTCDAQYYYVTNTRKEIVLWKCGVECIIYSDCPYPMPVYCVNNKCI